MLVFFQRGSPISKRYKLAEVGFPLFLMQDCSASFSPRRVPVLDVEQEYDLFGTVRCTDMFARVLFGARCGPFSFYRVSQFAV